MTLPEPSSTPVRRGDLRSDAIPTVCPFCRVPACVCDDADFFEILAEQEVYSHE